MATKKELVHYENIPQEVPPHVAKRLLKDYPEAADIINERLHEYRWAHDPNYAPEPPPAPETETDAEGKPIEGQPARPK